MAHKRVLHEQRGFRMSKSYAEQVMREHCTITWVIPGETIRDTTDEERMELIAARNEQVRVRIRAMSEEVIGISGEIPGLHFEAPKSTKYRAPIDAYIEMECPLAVKICRWPREAREFAMSATA